MQKYTNFIYHCLTFPTQTVSLPLVESVTPSESTVVYNGNEQTNITFSCQVTGTIPFIITWEFSGKFGHQEVVVLKSETVETSISSEGYTSNLRLSGVSSIDSGIYTCRGMRNNVSHSKAANLTVKGN